MLIVQSVIVGVIYLVLGFLEEYLSFPMCSRPMVVGSVIGFFLGDLKTGVMIGASLELELEDLLFMNLTSVKQILNRAREILKLFDLKIVSKSRHGMKISGREHDLRLCPVFPPGNRAIL